MRLKSKHDAAVRKRAACRLQRGCGLRRMMSVIVDQREVTASRRGQIAVSGEPAANASELCKRGADRRVRNAELDAYCNCSQRVRNVVHARQVQSDIERCGTLTRHAEFHLRSVWVCIKSANLRVLSKTVSQQRLANQWQDLA